MESNKPTIQALLVCESIIEDKASGKKSIIGIFTHLWATSFPCLQPQLGVYFCITDADGSYEFKLELAYLNTDTVIVTADLSKVEINDPLQICDFAVMFPPFVLPGPGRYEFRLSANGEFIGRKDFNVAQKVEGS